MNSRMPFFPPQPTNPDFHHNGFIPTHGWNDMRPEVTMNAAPANWDRNNRNAWKRNRNWQPKYNRDGQQPYIIPKKPFNPRFQQNRYDNGAVNYYDGNAHQSNWIQPHKTKPIKSPEMKDVKEQTIPGTVASKKKRKPMSKSYPSSKWDEKDAEKALQAEKDFTKNLKNQSLIIRFPDPELSKDIVKQFHSAIENVHFPQASTPRYCFAHLEENADINKVVSALEKIPFGQGFLSVDIKKAREENLEVSPKDIDPYTLYVGNLPLNVTKQGVIQQFSGCTRIDIGHPQQMKNTRYAFVRFGNVDDAIAAYRSTRNTQFESRSLIVRFRRINGNVGVPGETKQNNITKTKTEPVNSITPIPVSSTSTTEINNTPYTTTVSSVPSVSNTQTLAPDLSLVKEEPTSDHEDTCYDVKQEFSGLSNGTPQAAVKQEIKNEPVEYGSVAIMKGMELDPSDTFLPGDDDEDLFNGDDNC
ncbi:Painting of fourth [Carabus blaptoides fortunei]